MAFDLIVVFVGGALIVMTAIAILNAFTFARLRPSPPAPLSLRARGLDLTDVQDITATPQALEVPLHEGEGFRVRVSICIPARNEARVIGDTVRALLAQSYAHLDILILDDHSTDGTGELARAAASGDSRLRVISGAALPQGWHGKNWACQQLGEAATGDWLVFTDADVRWQPDAVAALIAQAERTRADLLTVWPTQTTITWSERLVVPLMALVVLAYLPALAVHHAPFASLAAANGQCLCFRASAYRKLGGHTIVRNRIIEDIAFARAIKRANLRLRTADGGGLIGCRMYTSWQEVRAGYAKNIIAGYGSVIGLLLGTLFHWAVFLLPWVWLVGAVVRTGHALSLQAIGVVGLCALGVGVRALTAAITRQRVGDALLMPVSALLMTIIAGQALWWRLRYGGVRWKGRTIRE